VNADSGRRVYDSPLRRQRAAETRQKIVEAGARIVHQLPSWDWSSVTFRAVAEQAGVGERTVYRYFPTERHLHDAVMQHLEEEAGVSYEGMTLQSVASVASRVFGSLPSVSAAPQTSPVPGPTFEAEDDRRREALRSAVTDAAPHWTPAQREALAAALDVIWGVPSFERLVDSWHLDRAHAAAVIGWLIDLMVQAVADDIRPPDRPRRRRVRS
jgi:AcrR family transcriptional regulator